MIDNDKGIRKCFTLTNAQIEHLNEYKTQTGCLTESEAMRYMINEHMNKEAEQ